MINQLLQTLAPYSRLGSIAGKLSAIGITGYGIGQLWTNKDDNNTVLGKLGLSTLYLMHMGAMTLTTAVMFGSVDVSPAVATAIVGTTSLLKGAAELSNEYFVSQTLKQKQAELENELKYSNIYLERMLILVEDLKERETEIWLLEQEKAELVKNKQLLKKAKKNKPLELKALLATLKESARIQVNKANIISNYFKKVDLSTLDIDAAIRELSEKATLHFAKKVEIEKTLPVDNVRNRNKRRLILKEIAEIDQELVNIGIINQQCIKYRKAVGTIQKCEAQATHAAGVPDEQRSYFKEIQEEQRLRNSSWSSLNQQPFYIESKSIAELNHDNTTPEELERLKLAILERINSQISSVDEKINNVSERFLEKRRKFELCHQFSPNELPKDFSTMFETMKELVDTQSQLSLTQLNERSKQKNVNFTSVSSVIALLLCLLPNGEYSRILQPCMLGVGLLAGASSMRDFHKKYLLKRKLINGEKKQLKRLVQDNIVKIKDQDIRQDLIKTLKEKLGTKEEEPDSQSPEESRKAKVKARVLIFNQSKQAQAARKPVVSRVKVSLKA